MKIIQQTIKKFTQEMGAKSVLQTKPQLFGGVNVPSLKVLQKDTFTPSLSNVNKTTIPFHSYYSPLKESEYNLFTNQVSLSVKNNFKGFDIMENLSPIERKQLIKDLKADMEIEDFLLFATGNKPSVWVTNVNANLKHKNIDTVSFKTKFKYPGQEDIISNHKIFLNRESVKEIIKDNFDVYQQRLNLPKDSSVDDIYNKLLETGTFAKCRTQARDIVGLTLGYPKDNSLLFHLNDIEGWSVHENKELAKLNLKTLLNSKDSPYKGLTDEYKAHLSRQIDKIDPKRSSYYLKTGDSKNTYVFNAFVEEPGAFSKILTGIRKAYLQMKKINENPAKIA